MTQTGSAHVSTFSQTEVDFLVIGAGAAGSTAAAEARALGARVAMVERWKVGGTCLNAGCDPTKALVRAARVMHEARHAQHFGITIGQIEVDWPGVIARVERVIDTIRGGDGDQNIRDSGVDLRKGHATFRGPAEIEVNGDVIHAESILLATGVRPVIPDIPGLKETGYITNIEAVTLPTLPRAMVIVGTGVIALEFAQVFARFGVAVTILGRNSAFLPHEEPELAARLRDLLEGEGIQIETGVIVEHVARQDARKRLRVQRQDGERIDLEVDEILVATGRTPNIDEMKPELAGVQISPAGVVVDPFLRTSADNIWAAGDCVAGAPRFTPIADQQGRIAAHNALRRDPLLAISESVVPVAIFTDPELARAGLTEAQARQAGYAVQTAEVPIGNLARGVIAGETVGMVKLVADAVHGTLLGGSVLAANGAELLGEIALAVRLGLGARDICETLHAYPTFSEGVFWTAWEMAKPLGVGQEATRGVESPFIAEEEPLSGAPR